MLSIALIASILIHPFANWEIPWRFATDIAWIDTAFRIVAGWFLIGLLANLWHVTYMLVGKDMSLADLEAKQLRDKK